MLRFLWYPLLPFRSFLHPILVAGAVVVPCWLCFRLYRRRARGDRPSLGREVLLLTFVAYLAALAAVTLSPNRSATLLAAGTGGMQLVPSLASLTCASASHAGDGRAASFCARNAGGNVLLFVPLGILVPLVWRRIRLRRGVQIALALSCGIELVQYLSSAWGSYRAADVNDVILNLFGACLGLALVSLLRRLRPARAARHPRASRPPSPPLPTSSVSRSR